MSTITIRTSEKEKNLIKEAAAFYGVTISDFMKQAALEKLEDEMDVQEADAAYEEYLQNPKTSSLEEIRKELGL